MTSVCVELHIANDIWVQQAGVKIEKKKLSTVSFAIFFCSYVIFFTHAIFLVHSLKWLKKYMRALFSKVRTTKNKHDSIGPAFD